MNCVLFLCFSVFAWVSWLSDNSVSFCTGLILRCVSHRYYNTLCVSFAYSVVGTGTDESGTSQVVLSLLDVCSMVRVY